MVMQVVLVEVAPRACGLDFLGSCWADPKPQSIYTGLLSRGTHKFGYAIIRFCRSYEIRHIYRVCRGTRPPPQTSPHAYLTPRCRRNFGFFLLSSSVLLSVLSDLQGTSRARTYFGRRTTRTKKIDDASKERSTRPEETEQTDLGIRSGCCARWLCTHAY